ncbi:hypothetical protein GPA10_16935 [Streptomyces sp. p1417]|uniref:Peptidase inhibitor family I36 n=1 Tax=Streptomyces typhae TaxID=2681492 RepID=A0A6L6WY16_9ACTN|nr:peptidase inhibitor family I36 protein [Streptomyces typhae]MVO86399.1 hypothetical protein [Streptomyces typhae]
MLKQLMASATVIVTAALGPAVGPTAADAAAEPCPPGNLCAYTERGYGGKPGLADRNMEDLLRIHEFANAVSVYNSGTHCAVTLYTKKHYTGPSLTLQPGHGIGDLTSPVPQERGLCPAVLSEVASYWLAHGCCFAHDCPVLSASRAGSPVEDGRRSMLKKLTASGAAIAAVAMGLAVGSATPATADPCPSGALCAYLSTNYSGDPGTVYGNNNNLLQYNKFNNAVSVSNSGTQCTVTIYSGLGRSGSDVDIRRGYGIGNLSGTPYYKNVASNHWC